MENPIKSDPDVMGGAPCFTGTRVPVVIFIDHILGGYNVDFFLEEFPTVSREHVESVMRLLVEKVPVQQARRAAG